MADLVVMDGARRREQGCQEELITLDGGHAEPYETRAHAYRAER